MKRLKPSTACSALVLGALAVVACSASSCAPSGFASEETIASVRVLASAADKPYARPGDTVTVDVLAYDGRAVQAEPMTLYWLPFVCENPVDDAYFGCFQQLAGGSAGSSGGSSGASGGSGAGPSFKPGVDLTPFLPTGPSYSFQMPADAITSHPSVPGAAASYGLAIVFNIACAGHLEIVPVDPTSDNPQQIPIGCFDSHHTQLGPDDWVFGFTRVYAYESITNANPVISSIDVAGHPFVPDAPAPGAMNGTLVVPRCDTSTRNGCPKTAIGPVVPAASQETQTQVAAGSPQKEVIWADFYSTFGSFKSGVRLLYDPTAGSLGGPGATDDEFTPPSHPGRGFIWMVVHDSRGGASWATVPVRVE
jgi:hypothetical protein